MSGLSNTNREYHSGRHLNDRSKGAMLRAATFATAMVSLASAPAWANPGGSSASAVLGPLNVQLNALDGSSSQYVDFSLNYSLAENNLSRIEVMAYSGDTAEFASPGVLWGTPFQAWGQTATTSMAGAEATIGGNGVAQNATFNVSGWASTDYSYAWYGAGVNDPYSGLGAWFTLSPHTELVISATALLTAQATGGDAYPASASHAYSQAWISFTGPSANGGGGSQSQLAREYLDGYSYIGVAPYSESLDVPLVIRFTNDTDAEMAARFELGVYASGMAFAVPEPETYALMLVGLGLVGIAVRQRASN